MSKDIIKILEKKDAWQAPFVPADIKHGDMPGDKVEINEGHMKKAGKIFPELLKLLIPVVNADEKQKAVITVCGGSGVGKSEIASLLSFYFQQMGIGSYTLSGDNYARRIPKYNDAERLHVFRESAIKGMAAEGTLTKERFDVIHEFQKNGDDANASHVTEYGWYESYLRNGRNGLGQYLGTENEINFKEVEDIIRQFKSGADKIWLRRMGREDTELWYESVDFSGISVLVVEWTHGNSGHYQGVDIPVLLNSTPEETLAHRRARNRDGATDSPFTMLVLEIEQKMLKSQAHKAKVIVSKNGELLSFAEYQKIMEERKRMDLSPMLNAYPDSMGGALSDIVGFLEKPELKNTFSSFYILPSLFHTDLDRGFSVIDYTLNDLLATREDLRSLETLGIRLKLDFVMNHASVLSRQFQDILKNGSSSKYKDFFIDWNKFWEGRGTMTEEGYIQPFPELMENMFFRKPGLPILMVRFPDGKKVPYWNTFYQEIKYPVLYAEDIMQAADVKYAAAEKLAEVINEGTGRGQKPSEIIMEEKLANARQREAILELLESRSKYLGQMDLNIKSPLVWEFYDDTLRRLSDYGAEIVRLDAFAYAPKEPGEKNFLNDPGTWELLEKVKQLAEKYQLTLLPEIHAAYEEKIYEKIAEKGYMTYDFFLPGLVLDALLRGNGDALCAWAHELRDKNIHVVNMLGCHDGIPLLDLKGMIPDERIQAIIDTVVSRGGYVKDLHGQKNVYYQVNAAYYSALGEEDEAMLLARAIQLFMPGKPQVWYLDLFAGKNDYEAMERAGAGGHKEINRTNLTWEEMEERLKKDVVIKQLEMLRFRNSCKAFAADSEFNVTANGPQINFIWKKNGYSAELTADLAKKVFVIKEGCPDGTDRVVMNDGV